MNISEYFGELKKIRLTCKLCCKSLLAMIANFGCPIIYKDTIQITILFTITMLVYNEIYFPIGKPYLEIIASNG